MNKPSPEPEFCVSGNKVYQKLDNSFFAGYTEIQAKTVTPAPKVHWVGGKIHFGLWVVIVKFLLWVHENKKNEGHVSLFYNPETKTWRAWAFPQEGQYAFVRLLDEDPAYIEQRKDFPAPWIQLGTVHHHSNMGAFASGTDKEDELQREGLHITLGKMSERILDFHQRISVNDSVVEATLSEWFEMPEGLPNALKPFLATNFQHLLTNVDLLEELYDAADCVPQVWKDNCKDKAPAFTGKRDFFFKDTKVPKTSTGLIFGYTPKEIESGDYSLGYGAIKALIPGAKLTPFVKNAMFCFVASLEENKLSIEQWAVIYALTKPKALAMGFTEESYSKWSDAYKNVMTAIHNSSFGGNSRKIDSSSYLPRMIFDTLTELNFLL